MSGFLQCAVAADGDADYGTDTTDFSGGDVDVTLKIVSGNAGDIMSLYAFTVERF